MRGVVRDRFQALRAGLAPLSQEFTDLWRHAEATHAILGNIFRRYDILLITYAACLAAMVLTNDLFAPRTIYFAAVLPVAFCVGLAFARQVLTTSIVFWAVAVYLLAMGIASLILGDVPHPDLNRHFRLVPLILTYLMVIGYFAADTRSLKRLLLVSCVIIAASAVVNMAVYLGYHGRLCPKVVFEGRLCAILGMPDYVNSTNLSAPYALYAVGALAALVHGNLTRVEQVLLGVACAILTAALVLTQSRGGLFAAALGFAVLAATGPGWCRIAVAALAAAVLVAVAGSSFLRDMLLSRGMSYRPELWSVYWSMGLERPFLGVGILDNIDVRMRDGALLDQPHNLVMSAFVRGGIVGAAAMLTVVLGSLYLAVRTWLTAGNFIPLALIVTMCGYGMFDYELLATYPTWPWITFWFPIGVCVGIETAMRNPPAALSP